MGKIRFEDEITKVDYETAWNIIVNAPYMVRDDPIGEIKNSEDVKFLSHCLLNVNDTHSQYYQDIFVLYETQYKKNGYFVEFGATDGKNCSNTYLLEKNYDWTGILAEPNIKYHQSLQENRNCKISDNCIYSKSDESVEFIISNDPSLSGIKNHINNDVSINTKINLQTISLYNFLEKNEAPIDIDYLSVDTEGTEYVILESFFNTNKKYKIHNMTVEHNYNLTIQKKLDDLLTQNGYKRKFEYFSVCDAFYKRII